jgi:3-deoxy-manno-octulosonate cytidylyltransferase (CMP-KDO synthetase)
VTSIGIIPARYASTRLPGKPLAEIAGRPMIQHVYERACRARSLDDVIVATDDGRIVEAVRGFGGKAALTSADHRSGTDRLAEVAAGLSADVIVNIQGDEPLVEPAEIDLLVAPFGRRRRLGMTTLATPITSNEDFQDPAVVKVVVDRRGYALYFSRQAIPYERDGRTGERLKHVGMYAYRRSFLLAFARLSPTPLETAESLEQLRALEHGFPIYVVRSAHDAISVDTEADLARVRALLAGPEPTGRGELPCLS